MLNASTVTHMYKYFIIYVHGPRTLDWEKKMITIRNILKVKHFSKKKNYKNSKIDSEGRNW